MVALEQQERSCCSDFQKQAAASINHRYTEENGTFPGLFPHGSLENRVSGCNTSLRSPDSSRMEARQLLSGLTSQLHDAAFTFADSADPANRFCRLIKRQVNYIQTGGEDIRTPSDCGCTKAAEGNVGKTFERHLNLELVRMWTRSGGNLLVQ